MEKMEHAKYLKNVYRGTENNGTAHVLTVTSYGILSESELPYVIFRDAQTGEKFDGVLTSNLEHAVVRKYDNVVLCVVDMTAPILTADGRVMP